jgi:hypothetical protein
LISAEPLAIAELAVSVVTPACSSTTSFTRHTSFGTSPPSFREPEA